MSKQLTIDEMLEAARESEMPGVDTWIENFETWAQLLGQDLARHLDVKCGSATFEGVAFGGLCCPILPKFKGQPCPDALKPHDETEWDSTAAA